MQLLKVGGQIFATASLVCLMASQAASADFCLTQIRQFPPLNGQDVMNLSCSTNGLGATAGAASASFAGGNRTINSNKTAGGAGLRVISQGLDSSGTITCTSEDATIGGGTNVVACGASTTRFRGLVEYVE